MLKQLDRLNVEADSRYASEQELQFLKIYLGSVDQRISAYKKICDSEDKILDQTKAQLDAKNPNLFNSGSKDHSEIWRRDISIVLRCSAAAMLINDLDYLRENLLLWHRTIVNANKMVHISRATYEVLPGIIKQFLTPDEAELMMPIIQLDKSILSQ
ncbi:Phycobilisome protein [Xenococcus sp. PCC 7305]|uniref:phycobilisome protein n=1 Tax=Xenococcus sp. PCC 7305 TaxID=102125 RepID=UPI0002AC4CBE|nr:phycobilisome protein [Xenococcus sp. PCC 7305]ELS00377.1 Phycobilisome protein [Xenococcus sp. PCC 7305]